jgi:hypothetical protein
LRSTSFTTKESNAVDRRKLLKGTLTAPLVMTVSPVLGAARTTFMACVDNAAAKPVSSVAPVAGINPDEWLRIDLDILQVTLADGKGQPVVQPGRFFVGPDKVSMFRLADIRPESMPATPVREFNLGTPGMQTRTIEKRRALAYVDREGSVVGYAWQPRGGAHITASCYASVIGGLGKARARML